MGAVLGEVSRARVCLLNWGKGSREIGGLFLFRALRRFSLERPVPVPYCHLFVVWRRRSSLAAT